MLDGRLVRHQHGRSAEHVGHGVVQQVEEGCGVQVSVATDLTGKEGLEGATAKETTQQTIRHVHLMDDILHFLLNILDVRSFD